jgi:hypothetical protein
MKYILTSDDVKTWEEMQKDIFVCAEVALDALHSVTPASKELLDVHTLKASSGERYRTVILDDDEETEENIWTFIPFSLFLGSILTVLHKLDIPNRLRLSAFVNNSLSIAFETYPTVAKPIEMKSHIVDADHSHSRFAELGMTAEEFEITQRDKYLDCYR